MQQIGRRIIYDTTTGKIIMDSGEMQGSDGDLKERGAISGLAYIDLPYGQDSDKFNRVKSYHVDITTKTVVFDELYDPPVDKDAEIATLQQQLLQSQGVI
ncbi:hypothetical protein D9O40_00655 [Clostridium autoethanogenum]|uniref:Uncharacterized protein n=1 Tax=Clostridium autoethanogenum TaxID=84023 RepID=A0A3M0T2M8_9CLOT|nr:hypothetical protein [Clostridium autoethanogenum]RMD04896.1 hypothetical protein D9O40_00655 [Clostridium autoethanogenum]